MAIFKQFAAAIALGALTSTATLAQEAVPPTPPQNGAPEGQKTPPSLGDLFGQMFGEQKPQAPKGEVCYTVDKMMAEVKKDANEDYIMDTYYDGDKMPKGHYTITAAPDTGSWTLILDPDEPNSKVANTSCTGEHNVFHVDGNDYGYPYAVEGMPWYGEIFNKPLRQLTSFEGTPMTLKPTTLKM